MLETAMYINPRSFYRIKSGMVLESAWEEVEGNSQVHENSRSRRIRRVGLDLCILLSVGI